MLKKVLILSVGLLFLFPVLIGCGSDNGGDSRFSGTRVELTVDSVTVDHREDMQVRDRGIHGVDMMLGEQMFVNINPSGLPLDEIDITIAEAIAIGMDLQDSTELERITINNEDAFIIQGVIADIPDFRTSIVMFVSGGYLYSMSYAAPEADFEQYYPYFIEIRNSVR